MCANAWPVDSPLWKYIEQTFQNHCKFTPMTDSGWKTFLEHCTSQFFSTFCKSVAVARTRSSKPISAHTLAIRARACTHTRPPARSLIHNTFILSFLSFAYNSISAKACGSTYCAVHTTHIATFVDVQRILRKKNTDGDEERKRERAK